MLDMYYVILLFFMVIVYMELKVPLIPIFRSEAYKDVDKDGKEILRTKSILRNQWEYW